MFRALSNTCVATQALVIRNFSTMGAVSSYASKSVGTGEDFRIFFYPSGVEQNETNVISPWHDIPLFANVQDKTYHYINEIPKGTLPKMEIATKEANNPIKQDIKNGKLREFTYGTLPFNYGALPQTWEDPSEIDASLGIGGDNDPIDIVEVSPGALTAGTVYEVKPIGVLALIDEGEVDWKVIAVNVQNPLASKLNDIDDLENVLPGFEHSVREWFRNYKTTDGKPVNEFGHNERILDRTKAEEIIAHTHEAWNKLKNKQVEANKLWVE